MKQLHKVVVCWVALNGLCILFGAQLFGETEITGAHCQGGANCTDTGGLTGKKGGTACGTSGKCCIWVCTSGPSNFNYCEKGTSGPPCQKSGDIDKECDGCTEFDCNCPDGAGNCDISNCSTNSGGVVIGKRKMTVSCV